ncbi:hypothetical protein AKJ09_09284 [Labilithrix luteola]|uniref:Uncharacterized protein n=1 Tax=Labilithrix luteola TaxID=1391654 RepID=A0A0K1QA00_9BACT|nr:hypothetical protein [Labilithrix luteola]AKV02621.1 hypothetical protein AKJ09_09284 [Labilithrix luteola]
MGGAWTGLVALLLTFIAFERSAGAEPPSLDLTWNAPSECPSRTWLESAVTRLVTRPPEQTLAVTGNVRESAGRWTVELEFQGAATGKRTLSAANCGSLSRGAAVLVALTIDPQAATVAPADLPTTEPPPPVTDGPPPPPPPPAPRPEPPQARELESSTPARTEPSRRELAALVFLGASAGRALLPGIAPSAVVGAGLVWRALRVDLSAEITSSTSTSLDSRPQVGADLSLVSLALRPCVGKNTGWLAIHGCVGVRGVRISGEGTGLAEAYQQTAYLVTFEPGALVRIPSSTRLAVELDGAAVLPLTRPEFVLLSNESTESFFRPSAVGARMTVGVGLRF